MNPIAPQGKTWDEPNFNSNFSLYQQKWKFILQAERDLLMLIGTFFQCSTVRLLKKYSLYLHHFLTATYFLLLSLDNFKTKY